MTGARYSVVVVVYYYNGKRIYYMPKDSKYMIAIGVLALIVIGAAFFMWTSNLDAERNAAYEDYQQCVKKEYGVSPTRWYAEHGEYPECY